MAWKTQADAVEDRLRASLLAGLAGDDAAYHAFLAELTMRLRGYFRRRLQRLPDEIEDMVQDTLIAVHTHRHTYRADLPLTAWVHGIARYKLLDLLRTRARREDLNDPLDSSAELFATTDADAAEARRDLDTLLQHLPERQRLAVQMMKIEGSSAAEAAAAIGMSEAAVRVSVHRGLKLLAARLGESR